MNLRGRVSRELGKGFALFAVAFALFSVVVAILAEVGLPESAASILFGLVTLVSFVVIGFASRTMSLPDFQIASRSVPAALNGMATASAVLASAGFLGIAGAFYAGSATALAVVAGWTVGFLVLSVLIAPYLRQTAAITVADFLAIRFGGSAVRLAAVIVTLACSFAFLVAEVSAAGQIAASLLDINVETGIGVAVIVIVGGSLLGGMRAVTMTAIAQYIVLTIAFVAPVTVVSLQHFDLPVPQLSYGFALEEIAELGGAAAVATTNHFLPTLRLDGFNLCVLALSLAVGVASMPHILMRSASASGVGAARRSAGWALLFVLPIIATAPAYAVFAQLALLSNPGAGPVDAGSIVLSLPEIADLSPALTALVAAGALAAMLAAATALLFAIANTIGHDFYSRLLNRGGPAGRRLIVTRIVLIAVACLTAWYATQVNDGIFALAVTSASLAASGLFPALLLGIWWKRATAVGALFGMLLGFTAAAAYVASILYGGMAPWQPLGSGGSGLPPMAAAFFGVPVGLLAIALFSHLSAPPSPERIEIIEATRRPTPSPFFDN